MSERKTQNCLEFAVKTQLVLPACFLEQGSEQLCLALKICGFLSFRAFYST